ncbi:MAG: CBM35 domain-containing protein, partial [Paludibacter sp.]
FGGVATSSFTVDSDTQITVPVPSNGTSGNITVTSANGTGITGGFLWLNTGTVYTNPSTSTTDYWQTHFYYAKCTDYIGYNTKEVAGSDYLDYNGSSSIYFYNIKTSVAGSYIARVTYTSGGALNVSVNNGTAFSSGTLTSGGTEASPSTFNIPVTLIAGTNTIKLTQATNWPRVLGIQLIGGKPIITSFTPTLQKNGSTVTITGVNFTGATAVSFGGTAATSFTVNSDTQITATVGTGTSGSVSVTAPLGTGTLAGFEWSPVICYDGGTSGANDFWLTHFYYAKCTDYVGSNTKEVAGSDYLDFNGGSNINFTNISVTNAGNYIARLTYTSGFATNALYVSVNLGANVSTSNIPQANTSSTFDIPVTLIAGANTLKLTQSTNWPRVLGIQLVPSQINLSGGNLSTIGISDVQLANTDLTVSSSEFVINATKTVKSLIVAPEAKLTISSGTLTATNGITLQSNSSGTSTLMDNYSAPTVVATVQQYVTAGRNWYMSAPLNNTADYTVLNRGASVAEYNELTGLFPAVTGTLTRGKGYIQVASASQGSTGTVSFNGTTNSGDVPVTLTYTSGFGNGFNLVGNPYPSYLSWSAVAADNAAANMPTGTMWYRTISYNGNSVWAPNTAYSLDNIVYNGTRFYRVTTAGTSDVSGGPTGGLGTTGITDGTVTWAYEGSIYIFATINASGIASPATVSNLVPPMQAFWVKSNGGTLSFKNAMRSHNTGGTNALKAPKISVNEIQLLRLNVTNGATADEAVIYASRDASNAFDTYDAPKYFNLAGSDQPEIYTQAGNEKLVINALNEITVGTEIPLGFVTEKGNDFTISASEFSNFGSEMQLILKDKQTNIEYNLSNGQGYTFSSVAVNNADRFSLLFRAPGSATGLKNTDKLNSQVFVNAANQISIIAAEKATYSIYNALGQKQYENSLGSNKTTINKAFVAGVYFVYLSVNGKSEIQKVIIR